LLLNLAQNRIERTRPAVWSIGGKPIICLTKQGFNLPLQGAFIWKLGLEPLERKKLCPLGFITSWFQMGAKNRLFCVFLLFTFLVRSETGGVLK
jgi:hypothetical protein